MSDDHKQTIANANAALKRAAASQTVRKERHEERVASLEKRRRELVDGEARAEAAAEPELLADVRSALASVNQALEIERDALAQAEHDLQESLQELRGLPGLARDAERAVLQREVLAATTSDPFSPSVEERALENARNGIAELEARLEVETEMAQAGRDTQDLDRRLRALDVKDKDAAARAQLAALKAARRGDPSDAGDAPTDDEPNGGTPPGKRKRTL